jgi:trigger factor
MEYKINKLPKNEVEIEITLNEKEWQDQVEGAYQRNKGKYNIEGFRKGKAPRKVIEKLYGPTIFYEDAVSEAFYVSYMEIMNKEKDFEPVDTPTLDVKEVSDKKVVIVSRVAVKPEVKLTKYTKFGVKPHDHKVTDEDVEHELKHAQEQNARLEEVEREVKVGDIANINYSGSVDGVVFDGGTAENYDLEIGSHTFIEGFEEQVVGLKAGEEKDINVTFPKEYHAENLKGKPAVFKVKVNSVKEKRDSNQDAILFHQLSPFRIV